MSQYNAKQLTVSDIIDTGFTFEIPDYQRGYRWGKTEVTDLLDDIKDVVKSEKSKEEVRKLCDAHPYCLQPIAFDTKNENQGRMIVVDGQQRLTTILLILKYIEETMKKIDGNILRMFGIKDVSEYCKYYSFQYDDPTRNSVFNHVIDNLNENNTENIDSYHITQAYQIIKQWSEKNIIEDFNHFISFAIKVLYGTSIIWYEIDQKTDGSSNDYYAKTNTGRIPLTNSELIKANLMLDEYCIRGIDNNTITGVTEEERRQNIAIKKDLARVHLQNERIKMSRQWDEIESNLRNDEFWYFLTEDSDEYKDTRIDFIFDIIAKKLYPSSGIEGITYEEFLSFNKERGSFTIIARYLKAHENFNTEETPIGLKVWEMAWNTYLVFKEWFESREWYHYIGYLICVGAGYDAKKLLELFTNNNYFSKEQVRKEIVNEIMKHSHLKEQIKEKDTDKDTFKNVSFDKYKNYLDRLDYRNTTEYQEIKDILLLFNVISVLSDSTKEKVSSRDTYFPFSRYKKENWNLEHIHSIADASSFTYESAIEYMSYLNEMLERMRNEKKASERKIFKEAIDKYNMKKNELVLSDYDENNASKFAAQDSAQLISIYFDSDLDENRLNGIGNMALLDEKTNKSYQNAPFFMKRMIIGDIVRGKKEGVSRFIPFCTRNVFDKAYTRHPNNMLHWTENDCTEYVYVIAETIWNYFNKVCDSFEKKGE